MFTYVEAATEHVQHVRVHQHINATRARKSANTASANMVPMALIEVVMVAVCQHQSPNTYIYIYIYIYI